jgi:replication factor A1
MDNEILEQYNKVKDKLSEEEFLSKMDELRSDYDNLDYDEVDLAKRVVDSYFVVDDISSDETEDDKIVMNDYLKERYDEVKDFLSEEEFIVKINEIAKKYAGISIMGEETFADQVIAEYISKENEYLSEREEYATNSINLLEKGNNQSLIGTVMSISNYRSFKTRKGGSGKVCNVKVEDKTGSMRVTLWTENIKHLKNIKEGDIVRVDGVDIKDGYAGLEATMRPNSKIKKAVDLDPNDYPKFNGEITQINDVEADTTVNVIARITRIPSIRNYNKNGREGQVCSLELKDASGSISYTLWNKNVELIEDLDLNDGDSVKILQAYVTERNDEKSLTHRDGRIIKGDFDVPDFDNKFSKIDDLDEDVDVAIIGVVTKISEIKDFVRKSDQSKGQLRNFTLTDDTNSIRVTLWGDTACLDINKGDIVKLIGGKVVYDDFISGYSINTNFSTQITVNPKNLSDDDLEIFESIRETLQPISLEQVTLAEDDNFDADVIGRIMSVGDVRTFERPSDGSTGHVRSALFSDGGGVVQLSLWDDKSEIPLKVSEAYLIENARVRFGMENINLNVGSSSRVIKLSENEAKFLPSFETLEKMIYEYREISEVEEFEENIYVIGRVFEVFDMRELERDDGSKYFLRNIEIADNSQAIRVSLWGENAKREFEPGEPIKIQNPRVDVYNDQLTLNVSGSSAIVRPSDDELSKLSSYDELMNSIYVSKEINAIQDDDVNVRVTGKLTDVVSDRLLIRKCPNCNNRINNDTFEDSVICEFCGEPIEDPYVTIMIPATLEDDTGDISITFFDNLVEELLEMPKDEIVELVLEDPGILDGKIEDLEGLNVEVIANINYDTYNESFRLNPRKILNKYY